MAGCDVLLFGTMSDIGPTVRDDLAGHGLDVVLVDFAQNTPRDFWGYDRGLRKAIETYSPRAVIPIGNTLFISRIAHELGDPAVLAAAPEAVELLDSKVRTYGLAEELGILQPRRFTFEEIQAQEKAYAENSAAAADSREDIGVIFKRNTSFGGSGVHRPRSLDSLRHLIEHENGTPYLIEEYIPGEDLSVDCIRAEGYFRGESYVSLGRVYTQGPAVERRRTDCPAAVAVCRRILDHLDYRGVCGFDFRLTPDGRLFLLEANPRLTGGLKTQLAGGFDIPAELLVHLTHANARVPHNSTIIIKQIQNEKNH